MCFILLSIGIKRLNDENKEIMPMHLMIANGTNASNRKYCSKDNNEFTEFGDINESEVPMKDIDRAEYCINNFKNYKECVLKGGYRLVRHGVGNHLKEHYLYSSHEKMN